MHEIVTKKKNKLFFLMSFTILCAAALAALMFVNRAGFYPLGADTYGHLYKANILYDSIKSGNLYLNYDYGWYNGVQPFRYWAPFPYYMLAALNLAVNNIMAAYNAFILIVFIVGGTGWLLWGYYTKRQHLALVISILWFFVPDNLRVLFSEGNLPFVAVNMIIPYVILMYYRSINERKAWDYLLLSALMGVVTLSHAMLSAMLGLSLFLLSAVDSCVNKRYKLNFISLIYAFLGIMSVSFWLYPALKGGIMSIDKDAVAGVMKSLTYPLHVSLNPAIRFSDKGMYYYGAAFALLSLFGMLFSDKLIKVPFFTSIIILMGTTKTALPLLIKLPISQLFWMRRFTSISMALILTGLIMWKRLRKSLLAIIIALMVIDSGFSFYVLGSNGQFPAEMSKTLDAGIKLTSQRVAMLDSSRYESFPSYYIGYNTINPGAGQVYGWAWQGASTADNIVMLNTALENGYYGYMFDRALELGADVLIVKKDMVKDYKYLESCASQAGYLKSMEDESSIIYKYPVTSTFGTSIEYKGIAIGKYSSNAVYIFPEMQWGKDIYIDDYSYESLKNNKIIFLSGFKYHDKNKAEALLLKLSNDGVRVVVDATGLNESFLGVRAEPITIKNNFSEFYYKNKRLDMTDFPEDYREWRANFLSGIRNDESCEIAGSRRVEYVGNAGSQNIYFIGLNIPYYAFLTKDSNAVRIMEDLFSLKAYEIPERKVHEFEIIKDGDLINIKADSSGIYLPMAALDAFKAVKGSFEVKNSLIYLNTRELSLKITYPYFNTGIILSIISLFLLVFMTFLVYRRREM